MDASLEALAYKYAVKNAFEHGGKASAGAVLGKVKALRAGVEMGEAAAAVKAAVEKVNALAKEELEKAFRRFEGEGFELKPAPQREGLPALEGMEEGKVVTRFAPNPNGPFHVGNARAAYMSWAYAEKYGGTFLLRFEDTDPKVKRSLAEAEQLFKEDLDWLGCNPVETFWASDRLELYYGYMRELIRRGHAYVCMEKPEEWQALVTARKACPDRARSPQENEALFEKMLGNSVKEGEAVLRLKTDLNHPDPSVRDWWMARCVDKPNHPRAGDKYHVWPSYMFQAAIDDHEMGVTLIIRGQEHAQNQTKQEYLYKYMDWTYPHAIHFGRLKLGNMVLSKSKIQEGIESGLYRGWDDPRLGTLRALRRRGFKPGALKKVLMEVNIRPNDASISVEKLADYNTALIQGNAPRMTFVVAPVALRVKNGEEMTVDMDGELIALEKGEQRFWVSASQLARFGEGGVFRLRNAFNVKLESVPGKEAHGVFAGRTPTQLPIVPWVKEPVSVTVVMDDGSEQQGLTDHWISKAKEGDALYFDHFGFVRVDVPGENPVCWFTHP